MLKNLVGGSPRSERAGKSPRAAARKLRAVVESLEGRTMMSVALMSVAVSGVAGRVRPIPAEVTKVTSSRVTSNLASLAPTPTPDLKFDTPLLDKISELLKTSGADKNFVLRKSLLLNYALLNYERLLGTKPSMHAYKLTDAEARVYKTLQGQKPPTYFDTTKLNNLSRPATSVDYATNPGGTFYNYNQQLPPQNAAQFWVDFANSTLGGGVFGTGFLQEETMFLETPELANAAAQSPSLLTRTGHNGPLGGSPTPLIFLGANRVMDIGGKYLWMTTKPGGSSDRADENWRKQPINTVLDHDPPLTNAEPINVLSMAAPYLPTKSDYKDQTTQAVVDDLFNTFDAGFTWRQTNSQAKRS